MLEYFFVKRKEKSTVMDNSCNQVRGSCLEKRNKNINTIVYVSTYLKIKDQRKLLLKVTCAVHYYFQVK